MLVTSIFSFSHILYLPKTNFNLAVTVILPSADAFNMDQSEILSCGKELIEFQIVVYKLYHLEEAKIFCMGKS